MRNDYETNYLAHHDILGMKWGIRKYQNPDGTLTAVGKLRYNADGSKKTHKERRDAVKKAKAQKKALEKASVEENIADFCRFVIHLIKTNNSTIK